MKKKYILPLVSIAGALGVAGAGVALLLKGERLYFKSKQDVEITTAINIDETLFRAEKAIEEGQDISYYYKTLGNINPEIMSADQKLKYTMLWGDMYLIRYQKSRDAKSRQVFFDKAVRQYNIASQLTSSVELKSSLNRRVGELLMENKNWGGALELFKKSYPLLTLPREKWQTDMSMAQCYIKLNKMAPAFQKFTAASQSDKPDIRGEAIIAKANLLLDAISDNKLKKQLIKYLAGKDPALVKAISEKHSDHYFKSEAEKLFIQAQSEVGKVSPVYSQGQLGQIEIAVMDKNNSRAYRISNRLLNGPAPKESKVKAILLLAKLEEGRGEYKEAIKLVKRSLQKYPVAASSLKAGTALYNLYKKIKNWNAAFSVARNLFQRTSDPDAICKLINDFSSGENLIFNIIINSKDRKFYVAQLLNVYADLKANHLKAWKSIRVNAYYVLAQLYYASEDFDKAQDALNMSHYYVEEDKADEKILRLDLLCALKAHASPAVIICRSRRYLNRFPKGGYYREALLELLRNYYKIGLYDSALDISRKIYADELDVSRNKNINRNRVWVETVSIIAACYQKLGKIEKANQLLRSFSDQIMVKKYGPDVYYFWSLMAETSGQNAEALRRLTVALMYTKDPRIILKLKVAQSLLLMKEGSLKDFYDADELLKRVRGDKWLQSNVRQLYERQLYEEMLKYALSHSMNDDFDNILNSVVKHDSKKQWAQYWVLRALTPTFMTNDLKTLSKAHERILNSKYTKAIDDPDSYEFIREQLKIIRELIRLEDRANYLKETKGVKI